MSTLIPKHWDKYRLKDVFELRNGYTPSKNNPEFWDGGKIPWFRMEDIRKNGRILSESILHISEKAIKGDGLFKAGSFILATTATIGEHAWLIADSLANQRFTNLKIRKSLVKEVQPKFLFYYFFIIDKCCHAITRCTTFSAVNMDSLKMFTMYFPSLAEQQRIADYLDIKISEIDRQVSLLTSKRDAYLCLKKSIINRAVTKGLNYDVKMKDSGIEWIGMIPKGWEVKRMKDICTLSPNIKSCSEFEYASYLPMEGLRLDQIEISDELISALQGKYTPFEDNDLLVAKVTPCFENGNIAIAKGLTNGIGFGSSEIFVLRANKYNNIRFLYYISLSSQFQDKACATMCGVGGLKRISPLFMRSHTIAMPPLSEQQAIAAYLDEKCSKIDTIVANLDKQISKYADLKRSLIDEVITGKRAV